MPVLIDTSVWFEYFRTGSTSRLLEPLIDENLIVTNEVILSELIPFLMLKNYRKLINPLKSIQPLSLHINWDQLTENQYKCLKWGINGIGIPDLIIAQNAEQNNCPIYSLDKHFQQLKSIFRIQLVDETNIS